MENTSTSKICMDFFLKDRRNNQIKIKLPMKLEKEKYPKIEYQKKKNLFMFKIKTSIYELI